MDVDTQPTSKTPSVCDSETDERDMTEFLTIDEVSDIESCADGVQEVVRAGQDESLVHKMNDMAGMLKDMMRDIEKLKTQQPTREESRISSADNDNHDNCIQVHRQTPPYQEGMRSQTTQAKINKNPDQQNSHDVNYNHRRDEPDVVEYSYRNEYGENRLKDRDQWYNSPVRGPLTYGSIQRSCVQRQDGTNFGSERYRRDNREGLNVDARPFYPSYGNQEAQARFPQFNHQRRRDSQYQSIPMKIAGFNGKGDWATWIAQFEVIANRQGWTADERLDNLLPRLEGLAAQFAFTQLPPEVTNNYYDLIGEMNCRFRIIETSRSLTAKFSRRTQRPHESIEDYAADLKQLYDRAHRGRDRFTRDQDLVRQFLNGLYDESIRCEIEFNKDPYNIDEAVYHAVNLIQIRSSIKKDKRGRQDTRRAVEVYGELDEEIEEVEIVDNNTTSRTKGKQGFKKNIRKPDTRTTAGKQDNDQYVRELEERIKKLEAAATDKTRKFDKREVKCFRCQGKGHYARECGQRQNVERNTEKKDIEDRASKNTLNTRGPTSAARGRSQ